MSIEVPGLDSLADKLIQQARTAFHRRLLVLAGDTDWGLAWTRTFLCTQDKARVLWLSDHQDAPERVPLAQARRHLGREFDLLVYNAHSGFDPEAFGAAVGTLRGGGLLLLLTPDWTQWPDFSDPQSRRITVAPYAPEQLSKRFIQRLHRVISADAWSVIIQQGVELPSLPPAAACEPNLLGDIDEPDCHTQDQQTAVEALIRVVKGHRRRPALLVADRGRGKSAALGIAAAKLLKSGYRRILLTGPRLTAIAAALEHAHRLLPDSIPSPTGVELGDGGLSFFPPDELIRTPRPGDLLLVDEAAAIPVPLLKDLLERYPRIAFATTVHGYEGSGRGFAVHFRHHLGRQTPGWREIPMAEPIRWACGDPLEALSFRALMLDAEPVPEDALQEVNPEHCEPILLDRDQLARDDSLLSQVFGLLVAAHYRTSPLDLRYLLDGPNIEVHALRHQGHILATALTAREGALDLQLSGPIYLGERRLQGHLLPQSLSQHLGLKRATSMNCLRIMRIAVHPALHRRGLGQRLLKHIASANAEGLDFMGASFGADTGTLAFWLKTGYRPVRLGVSRDAASGTYSVNVLRPVSPPGQELLQDAERRFRRHFPHMLADTHRGLDPELVATLLGQDSTKQRLELESADLEDLRAYAFGKRQYEVCPGPLWQLACHVLNEPSAHGELTAQERQLLVMRVLQKRTWKVCAEQLSVTGKKQSDLMLREIIGKLLENFR